MTIFLCVKRLWPVYFMIKPLQLAGQTPLRRLLTMSQTSPPILSVSPSRALVDETFQVLVENLPAGSPVTLHSLHHSEDKDYWESYGHYISDQKGIVSVAEDLSFGGTYTGKEAMGLLWSMRPVPGSRRGLRLRKKNVCSPMLIRISVYSGHTTEGFREQTPLASTLVERWYMAPGVQRINVSGVEGTLFLPSGPGPFPGLLDMWGGGGGLVEYRASLLASHGYATLALGYLAPGELYSAGVEFSYFETAYNILKTHPQVNPDKIGLFGLSLGSIVSIQMAAESSVIKPVCIVCISGSHVRAPDKNFSNIGALFNKHSNMIRVDENEHQTWREMGQAVMSNPSNRVDVGKINCPMLLVNGSDDQNWPASECAEDMARTMKAAGKAHLLHILLYPEAGHLIEPPFSPHCRASNLRKNTILMWGGTTKPHSDAQEDSWRKILAYLQHHLYSSTSPKAKM